MKARTLTILLLTAALAFSAGAAALAQVADHREIEFPPLPEFEIPQPDVFTLRNGMKIFLLEDHELPLVAVTALIRTGSVLEPAAKTGLGDLVGTVLRTGGAGDMSGDEIDDFLEARAASVETGITDTRATASASCLVEDFEDVVEVLADVLRAPRFAEEKLELAKLQVKTGIARRNDNVLAITSREFRRLIYGPDSPVGRLPQYATIGAIERQDLVDWHHRYYHPNNVYLGVVGDFDIKAMKKRLEGVFGDWQRGPRAPDLKDLELHREQAGGVFFIDKQDVTQANVRLGHLGITYHSPDFFQVTVMNEVLGGGFSGRLLRNVRTKKGLAYSVFGGVGAGFSYPGITQVGLQTKSSSMGEAVDALREEIDAMRAGPPTDEELQRAKESILNSFIFNYASTAQILDRIMIFDYYGLPEDFLDRYRSNVEKVTAQEVADAATKYLHPERMSLLVVGRAEDFDRPLASFGEVTTLDIAIPAPPDTTTEVEKTSESEAMGRELLARVAETLGGPERSSLRAVRSSGRMVVSMGAQSMSLGQEMLIVFPDKLRQTMSTPMGEQVLVLNGDQGYAMAAGQSRPLPAEQVAKRQAELGRDLRHLVSHADDPDVEALAAGQEELDGSECGVVAVSFRGVDSRLWVAPDGKVLKQTYRGDHPMTGAPAQVEIRFGDYREIEGRQVAHTRVMSVDGQELATVTLDSVEFDPEVEEGLFEIPAVEPAAE